MHGNCRSLAENLALYGEELRPRKKGAWHICARDFGHMTKTMHYIGL